MRSDEPSVGRSRLGLLDIVRQRRSVRWFSEQPVPSDQILTILEAGSWAPSPHGSQPWRFVLIESAEHKRVLADSMASTWRRQLQMDGQDPNTVEIRLAKSRERLLSAPVLVLLALYVEGLDRYPDPYRQSAELTMAVHSLGAAAQNMLLTAYALGLDGGWMCAPLFCPETVVSALGLDPALMPQALLTFGYAAREPVRRQRAPLEELIIRPD